ncbi:Redoxin [Chitinophaga jiangningensis]|uniref:Redoxin n=1 Tax=Chitinophaga jiangningensis TaxID=1419482 RepID=A0A1M7JX39_9BACT|nr:redoxin family protein [Chitinophaga jiangningensis]SHM57640.1 Redoxin [Chitinophaga jiangningensis]
MKKLITLVALIAFLTGCFDAPPPPPFISGKEGEKLQPWSFLKTDSTYGTIDTASGNPAIVFYTTYTCPYCKAELEALLKKSDSLGKTHVYVVTNANFEEIKQYSKDFELDKYQQNFSYGIDTGYAILKYFGIHGVPFIAVYNRHHVLKQAFNGVTETKKLREVAAEN